MILSRSGEKLTAKHFPERCKLNKLSQTEQIKQQIRPPPSWGLGIAFCVLQNTTPPGAAPPAAALPGQPRQGQPQLLRGFWQRAMTRVF